MANELIYQAGGTLVLDEPWTAQPSSATLTLTTMGGQTLPNLGSGYVDVTAAACTVDDLELTLPATNPGAKVIAPSLTEGLIGDLTSPGYIMLLDRGGRKHWQAVSEYAVDQVEIIVPPGDTLLVDSVTNIRLDPGLPFAVKAGDKMYGLRVSYTLDLSAVTSTFVGKIQAVWRVTVAGVVHVVARVYNIVKQTLPQPATWADVLNLRPDAQEHMSNVPNKEALVTRAWETVVQDLFALGIRHNLVVQDGSTTLRDATVAQCLYNLTVHQNLPVPRSFENQGDIYLDRLVRDKDRALGQLSFPVDENQDGIISSSEIGVNRRAVFFNSTVNRRQDTRTPGGVY